MAEAISACKSLHALFHHCVHCAVVANYNAVVAGNARHCGQRPAPTITDNAPSLRAPTRNPPINNSNSKKKRQTTHAHHYGQSPTITDKALVVAGITPSLRTTTPSLRATTRNTTATAKKTSDKQTNKQK